jgi:hypothetical protein
MNQEHASKEDFELEKGYLPLKGRTLEEVIIDGESDDEKSKRKIMSPLITNRSG